MNCNCSNEYCWSKVPVEALIITDDCGKFRVRVVQDTSNLVKHIKILEWDEWQGLCDDMRCTPDGRRWKPYVTQSK